MNTKTKTILAGVIATISLCMSAKAVTDRHFNGVDAAGYNSPATLWPQDYNDFVSKDYAPVKYHTFTSPSYWCGAFGHRRVVRFGGDFKLKVVEVEKYCNYKSVGSLSSFKVTTETTKKIAEEVTVSTEMAISFTQLIKASVTFESMANVEMSHSTTTKLKNTISVSYCRELSETRTINEELNTNNFLDGKSLFRYSRVALVLDVEVLERWSEEKQWFRGWVPFGADRNPFYARYYISEADMIVYSDGTFGDKTIGEFKLNENIKSY